MLFEQQSVDEDWGEQRGRDSRPARCETDEYT